MQETYQEMLLRGGGMPIAPQKKEEFFEIGKVPDTIEKLKEMLKMIFQQPEPGDGFNFKGQ